MPNVTEQGNKIPLELEVALGSTVVPGDEYDEGMQPSRQEYYV